MLKIIRKNKFDCLPENENTMYNFSHLLQSHRFPWTLHSYVAH